VAVAGPDVVEGIEAVVVPGPAVVVVSLGFAPVVVVLEPLVEPHAASRRDRAARPIEVRMLRRTGDLLG
jgi:hypothetical protein